MMNLKPDWTTWLHAYKEREVNAVFVNCPEACFPYGLELGGGDGYQAGLISKFVQRLISTEINENRLARKNSERVEYRICGAEEAAVLYSKKSFDIVFSSNLLEHVNDPVKTLQGIHGLLRDGGVAIHVMPSPFWKLCQFALYLPAHGMVLLERIARDPGLRNHAREARAILREFLQGITTGSNASLDAMYELEMKNGNNPGVPRKRPSFPSALFMPRPHGISQTNWEEFRAFGKRRWRQTFHDAGFSLITIKKGPAASGYGLGWERAGTLTERAGLASEYIYVARKKGHDCAYERYFTANKRQWVLRY
jgi:SAM-dependent methyltransferase